jgi:hypothetical protein
MSGKACVATALELTVCGLEVTIVCLQSTPCTYDLLALQGFKGTFALCGEVACFTCRQVFRLFASTCLYVSRSGYWP